jgi:UDP-glucose 4-epimerase
VKHILVTGGNGFIGRYVVEELHERGYTVAVLDRHAPVGNPRGAALFFGDIKDRTLVSEAVAHVDGVIHLAGVLGTQETVANPLPAAETNILGGLNVLEACSRYGVPLVYIAVGNYWMNNTYSITKSTIERFVDMFVRFRDSRMSVVRAMNAYGPRQVAAAPYGPSRVRKVMPSFICRALSGEDIEIYGDGTQVMDMIYVTDVAKVLVTALEMTSTVSSVYEAGTGRLTTVNDIAAQVVKAVGEKTGSYPLVKHLPMRPGEDERSVVVGDPQTLAAMDVFPLVTLEEGVAKTVDYFADYLSR